MSESKLNQMEGGTGDPDAIAERRRLKSVASMLDRVLDDSHSLRNRLGNQDRDKFDEHLSVTHDNNNYSFILTGGADMRLKHGRYLKFSDQVTR